MVARKTSAPAAASEPEVPFEAALERLEHVVEALEGGSLTLEDSLARYEEGVKLSRRLTQKLDEAEKRIEKLVAGEGEEPPLTTVLEKDPGAFESEGPEGQLPF